MALGSSSHLRVLRLSLTANYNSQGTLLPGRLSPPGAHALADVAPGTQRRGAAGKWRWHLDPAELWAREPEWRAESAVGSGGGDGAGRASMAAAAGHLGEAVVRGSVPGHVRPGCGSVLPAPGPFWTCGKMPPATRVGAYVPGWQGPGGCSGGSPRALPVKRSGAQGPEVAPALGDFWQGACDADTTLRGRKSGGGHRLRAGHPRVGGCAAPQTAGPTPV